MQVVGNKEVIDRANSLASRATRHEIAEWIVRAIPRHIRKTADLLTKFSASEQDLLGRMMDADGLPVEASQRVMVGFKAGEPIYRPNPKALTSFWHKAAEVMDWMESLDDKDRRVRRIERMSWLDAESLSKAWHTAVIRRAHNVRGDPSAGVRCIADLDDGAYVAELESKAALRLEGGAMSHCVGGYWNRVETKKLRIISLRDAAGMPAVTVELNRPVTIHIEGYGEAAVSTVPSSGASRVFLADFQWRAAQVRGKSNRLPEKKWLKRVVSYFAKEGIRWDEQAAPDSLRSSNGERSLIVYAVGRTYFSSPDAAIAFGEEFVAGEMAKGRHIRAVYETSGLKSIHEIAAPDGSLAVEFFDTLLPHCIAQLKAHSNRRNSLTAAIHNSGVAYVMSMLGDRKETKRSILSGICDLDAATALTETTSIVRIGADDRLDLVTHRIPLLPLALLSNGLVGGIEDEAIDRIAPQLAQVMTQMERRPDAIHAISPIENGSVAPGDIFKAFLICGLGDRLDRLASDVSDRLRSARSNIVMDLKRSRREGKIEQPDFNRLMNLFADGYEDRIEGMINDMAPDKPYLVMRRPQVPVIMPAQRIKPAPLKTYAIPAHARMATR
jgi:hypothetical protein